MQQLSNEDQSILREALRRASEHAGSEADRRRFTELLGKMSGVAPQLRDGFLYDYNDDQWRI